MSETQRRKQPAIAVLLNLWPLPLGLGYLYICKFGRFFAVVAVQLFSVAPMSALGLRAYNNFVILLLSHFLVGCLQADRSVQFQKLRVGREAGRRASKGWPVLIEGLGIARKMPLDREND
jgi:hypothetical protein